MGAKGAITQAKGTSLEGPLLSVMSGLWWLLVFDAVWSDAEPSCLGYVVLCRTELHCDCNI